MSTKPKQIVVDKDAFIRIGMDALCDFAADHLLLVCDTLLYECATTSKSNPKERLSCCARLIKAGAYYCSCSVGFLQFEGNYCRPYPWFLPDLESTKAIRTDIARLEDVLNSPDKIKMTSLSRWKVARKMILELSAKLKGRIDSERPEVGEVIKKLPTSRLTRLGKLFERVDKLDIHQTALDSVPKKWIKNKDEFCLSPEWMSWHFLRLTYVIPENYYYLRQTGGVPGDVRAEHDYQDMEYVLLLSRADALLTQDDGCLCLAKAAFTNKDVFSSLDEVPEDYVCHWNQ